MGVPAGLYLRTHYADPGTLKPLSDADSSDPPLAFSVRTLTAALEAGPDRTTVAKEETATSST